MYIEYMCNNEQEQYGLIRNTTLPIRHTESLAGPESSSTWGVTLEAVGNGMHDQAL